MRAQLLRNLNIKNNRKNDQDEKGNNNNKTKTNDSNHKFTIAVHLMKLGPPQTMKT